MHTLTSRHVLTLLPYLPTAHDPTCFMCLMCLMCIVSVYTPSTSYPAAYSRG